MNKSIFVIIVLLVSLKSFGQTEIDYKILNIPVLITANKGHGSGFFYIDSLNLYLITAKHNIFDPKSNKFRSDSITVQYYNLDSDTSELNSLTLDVVSYSRNKALLYNDEDDIIVLPICEYKKIDSNWKAIFHKAIIDRQFKGAFMPSPLGKQMFVNFKDVTLANDIILLGYPKSLGLQESTQYDFNIPLLRRGTLAGKNYNNHTFIIDCPSYGGNSGGPVFNYKRGQGDFRVIGIVVSFIPWGNQFNNSRSFELDNSGYSVVEPIDNALRLIKKYKGSN